jgi:hypothetical protein
MKREEEKVGNKGEEGGNYNLTNKLKNSRGSRRISKKKSIASSDTLVHENQILD